MLLGLSMAVAAAARAAPGDHPASASPAAPPEGFSLRAGGDLVVAPGDAVGAAVVLGGNAEVRGRVGALLVTGGNAVLDGAQVGDLTVVGGHATLRNGTRVTGDVRLVGSELERSDDSQILGAVERQSSARWGAFPFGMLFAVGLALAFLVAALVAVALAPRPLEGLADELRAEPGRSLAAGLALWLIAPPVAIVCLMTVLGIPLGIGILALVLPFVAFVGYVVAGLVVGAALFRRLRAHEPPRLWAATALGTLVLILLGAVPFLGALVTMAAGLFGGGALTIVTWRALRRRGGASRTRPADTSTTTSSGTPIAPAHA
jgi:hypothetical protein